MMDLLRAFRLVLVIVSIGVASTLIVAPGVVSGQGEEPCEFQNPNDPDPDFHVCLVQPHIFQTECEGIDCYQRMESCCEHVE